MSMRRLAYLLLLATLVAIPFEDIYKLPGIGTLARVLGLMAFAAWALSALAAGRMKPPASFHTFAFAFVTWVGLSLFWSLDTSTTLERIETFLQLLALSLVVWDLCDSQRMIRAALQALVLGFWVSAGSVLINFTQGVEAYYGRFAASGADPNYQSMSLAIGMVIAWYLSLDSTNPTQKIINLLFLPVAGVAMGLTGSRAGFLAGFLAIAYILSTVGRLRPIGFVGLLVAVAIAITAISFVVPDSTLVRISSVGDEIAEGDLNGRAGIWREAGDAFVDRPLLGIGAGASRAVLPTGKVGHNVTVTVALELGIVGLFLFAALVVLALRSILALPTHERRFWLGMLSVWLFGSLSLSLETRKLTWVVFSLAVLAQHTVRHAESLKTPALDPSMRSIASGGGLTRQPWHG